MDLTICLRTLRDMEAIFYWIETKQFECFFKCTFCKWVSQIFFMLWTVDEFWHRGSLVEIIGALCQFSVVVLFSLLVEISRIFLDEVNSVCGLLFCDV